MLYLVRTGLSLMLIISLLQSIRKHHDEFAFESDEKNGSMVMKCTP